MTVRPALILALATTLAAACDKTDPCGDFVDAVAKCYKDGGVELPAGYDYDSQCDSNVVLSDAFYSCAAETYSKGDCSTADGTGDIAEAFGACRG